MYRVIDKDTQLAEKTAECQKLLVAQQQLTEKLNNRQEEWQQTGDDYAKLKKEYNLVTNTRDRLEYEKAEMVQQREQALQAEAEKLRLRLEDEFKAKLQSELSAAQKKYSVKLAALRKELDGLRKVSELEQDAAHQDSQEALALERTKHEAAVANHREAMTTMQSSYDEQTADLKRLADEAREQHEAEKAVLLEEIRLKQQTNQNASLVEAETETEPELPSSSCENCTQEAGSAEEEELGLSMQQQLKVLRDRCQNQMKAQVEDSFKQTHQLIEAHLTEKFRQQSRTMQQQAEKKLKEAEQLVQQLTKKLKDSEMFSAELQQYSDKLEDELDRVREQARESTRKRDETIKMAEQMQARCQEETQRALSLESELNKQKLELAKLQADLSEMKQDAIRLTQVHSERENRLKRQLTSEHRHNQAAKSDLERCQGILMIRERKVVELTAEIDQLKIERDALKAKIDRTIKELSTKDPPDKA